MGTIGFFQNYVLESMDNLWFDRMASKDRKNVAKEIKAHINDVSKPPLLVFPEGTCVRITPSLCACVPMCLCAFAPMRLWG